MPPAVQTPSLRSPAGASDEGGGALAAVRGRRTDWAALDASHSVESAYELERADRYTEASRIKVRLVYLVVIVFNRFLIIRHFKILLQVQTDSCLVVKTQSGRSLPTTQATCNIHIVYVIEHC